MSQREPTIFGLTATDIADIARRATRQAVLSDLRAGIPVTGMVNGKIRTLLPTDPAALKLLQADADAS
ncbi:hypothetical protein [Acidovorax sp. CF316]|uniref:hypothetical protein n=1 Tax=Acidovorax sp. CF316 TaxID=1144317 RepID=UPI000D37B352|nr:hypothetical protein [Acidovorax sp. CF316]